MAQAVPGLYLQRVRAKWLCLPCCCPLSLVYRGGRVAHLLMEPPAQSGALGMALCWSSCREIVPITVPWIIYSLKQSRWKQNQKTRQCSSATFAVFLWSVRGKEGMQKTAWAHSHPHTDLSFTPQRIIVHRVLEEGCERTAFIQRFGDN